MRPALDAVLTAIARLVQRGFFRSVEVEGASRVPTDRPVLLVANHFNGFVDPVLLVAMLGTLPRFLAKATLWDVAVARPFLRLARLIPVIRRADSENTAGNASSFAACHDALAAGELVALFPEGTTHDDPHLVEVRTGAARIALGALEAGVEGLVIVPVGLTFEDKVALRSRALIRVGEPIDLDRDLRAVLAAGEAPREDDHGAVRSLTAAIESSLAEVTPRFDDVEQRGALLRAADVALRSVGGGEVPMGERERLAQRLAEVEARESLIDATARYELALSTAGVRDAELVDAVRGRDVVRGIVGNGLLVFVLASTAIVGAVVNAVPAALVAAAGRRPEAPVSKGTVRFLSAAVLFPVAWITTAIVLQDTLLRRVVHVAVLPLTGLATIAVLERSIRFGRTWAASRAVADRRGVVTPLLERREALVGALRDAAG